MGWSLCKKLLLDPLYFIFCNQGECIIRIVILSMLISLINLYISFMHIAFYLVSSLLPIFYFKKACRIAADLREKLVRKITGGFEQYISPYIATASLDDRHGFRKLLLRSWAQLPPSPFFLLLWNYGIVLRSFWVIVGQSVSQSTFALL